MAGLEAEASVVAEDLVVAEVSVALVAAVRVAVGQAVAGSKRGRNGWSG